jgi:FtsP/CotA-like multicopper oxidase with cupredoxin domain
VNTMNRRAVLRAGLLITTAAGLGACSATARPSAPRLAAPDGAAARAAEARRIRSGRTVTARYQARPATIDLGGRTVRTWAYDDSLPGRALRARKGDRLEITVANALPAPTTVHWHGLALRNNADGVPDVTQRAIAARGEHTYRFTANVPGTYWFHPHVGVQLDRGLYAPLIVEDPDEPLAYDDEWIVVLDDWIDGVTATPDEVLAQLRRGMGDMGGHDMGGHDMSNMDGGMDGMDAGSSPGPTASSGAPPDVRLMGATSRLLGGDAGDVRYPLYLINGRRGEAPATFTGKPRSRVRIRFINAGSDTAFRVALGGHRMRITHTDGFPVQHVDTDALLLGMGERYDVLVDLADGVFPLVALAEGKNATAFAVVRTGPGDPPARTVRPAELDRQLVLATDLRAAAEVRLPAARPDNAQRVLLTGAMETYEWGFDGGRYNPRDALLIQEGQRVRLSFTNKTPMWHPVHVHGHTFQVGDRGPRKDTVIVRPRETVHCDFLADNPGKWMVHCHNAYHAEVGMMRLLGYRA